MFRLFLIISLSLLLFNVPVFSQDPENKIQVYNFIKNPELWRQGALFDYFGEILRKQNPNLTTTSDVIEYLKYWQEIDSEKVVTDIETLRQIDEEIELSLKLINEDFNYPVKSIYVFIMSEKNIFGIEKMNGVGGFSFPDAAIITVYPWTNWQGHLKRVVVHELNHTVRIAYDNPYVNFLNWITMEGFAEIYVAEKFPNEQLSSWAINVTGDALSKTYERLLQYDIFAGFPPNQYEWFFGSKELEIPLWFGYSLGFDMVNKYRKTIPEMTWSDFIAIDSDEVVRDY